MVHQVMPDGKKRFRLTTEKFCELVEVLHPYISPRGPSPNFRTLDADKRLAACLYHLKYRFHLDDS